MPRIQLNPWHGVDNFHKEDHSAFQSEAKDSFAYLRLAENLELDDDGGLSSRADFTQLVVGTAGLSLSPTPWSGIGLFQDGGVIKSIDASDDSVTSLVTGLSAVLPVHYGIVENKVLWSNGVASGLISDATTVTNWGMAVPASPTLGTEAGSLTAGRYRVSCLFVDGNGMHSGAPKASAVTLAADQNITFDVTPDASATHVRIYASYVDSPDLWFCKEVAVGALPTSISNVLTGGENSSEALRTMELDPPPAGILGISSWGGYALIWKADGAGNQYLIRSAGNNHHLFDFVEGAWEQESAIRWAGGAPTGALWVATARGMIRYTGVPGTESWKKKQMDNREYATGGALLDGGQIPALKEKNVGADLIAVFASQDGLIFGTADGRLLAPQEHTNVWDVDGQTASIVLQEARSGVTDTEAKQLLVNLR